MDWTYQITSDGDRLSVWANRTGDSAGSNYGSVAILYDTTSTATDIELDYYPFFELQWSADYVNVSGSGLYCYPNADGKVTTWSEATSAGLTHSSTFTTETVRVNLRAASGSSSYKKVLFYIYAPEVGMGAHFYIDYVKFYSLINWSYYGYGGSYGVTAVGYYDSTIEAIVLEKEVDGTSNDYLSIKTEDTTINYYTTDMEFLVTAKADENSTARLRVFVDSYGGYDSDYFIMLTDKWTTYSLHLNEEWQEVASIILYLYDRATSIPSSGTIRIYIKDNITIRPSWYDASYDSYEADMTYSYVYGVSASEHGGKYHDSIWEQWMVCTDTGNEYTKYESSVLDISSDYWLGARYRVESMDVEVSLAAMDGDGTYKFVVLEQRNVEWHETWVYLGDELDDIHVLFTYIGDASDSLASGNYSVYFDWIVLTKQPNVCGDIYSESFANVDEWNTLYSSDVSISTTGDVMGLEMTSSTEDYRTAYTEVNISWIDCQYIELRYRINTTANVKWLIVYLIDEDNSITLYDSPYLSEALNTWVTWRVYIPAEFHVSVEPTYITKIKLGARLYAGGQLKIEYDYLRIASADKTGLCYDGSVFEINGGSYYETVSSDGDVLHMT